MAQINKLGKRTDIRVSLVKNQVSALLWYGKVETTLARSKSVAATAEKLITLAAKTHEDNVKVVKEIVNEKGVKVKKEIINDGPTKLNARRKIMASVNDLQEIRAPKESAEAFKARTKDINHPICEKIFNVYAPKYAKRAKELSQGGGYTRVIRTNVRRGDGAEMVLITLV